MYTEWMILFHLISKLSDPEKRKLCLKFLLKIYLKITTAGFDENWLLKITKN